MESRPGRGYQCLIPAMSLDVVVILAAGKETRTNLQCQQDRNLTRLCTPQRW